MNASFLKIMSPRGLLRLGLGFMFIYSGIDFLRHPSAWYWAIWPLPQPIQEIINSIGIDRYLQLQGVFELALAFVFLAWFLPKKIVAAAAFIAALEMAFILFFVGVDPVTFRDIGLLGAALALFVSLL